MPVLPSFADLGKSAKDLFDKNFHLGIVKTEIKTSTSSGVNIKTNGTHNTETSGVSGNMETSYKISNLGLTLTEKWDINNTLTTSFALEDKLIKGLKQTIEGVFEPNTGKKSAKVKNQFKHELVHLNADFHFKSLSPVILASTVVGHSGVLGGVEVELDAGTQAVQKLNYAVGYTGKDFVMHGAFSNGSDILASIYQKLSNDLETAVNLSWSSSTHDTKFGVAAKYNLDKSTFFKIRVDNRSLIGLAYCFPIRNGVDMTVAGQFDGKSINGGGHKLGLGLDFSL